MQIEYQSVMAVNCNPHYTDGTGTDDRPVACRFQSYIGRLLNLKIIIITIIPNHYIEHHNQVHEFLELKIIRRKKLFTFALKGTKSV
jgi:hypothetical protein